MCSFEEGLGLEVLWGSPLRKDEGREARASAAALGGLPIWPWPPSRTRPAVLLRGQGCEHGTLQWLGSNKPIQRARGWLGTSGFGKAGPGPRGATPVRPVEFWAQPWGTKFHSRQQPRRSASWQRHVKQCPPGQGSLPHGQSTNTRGRRQQQAIYERFLGTRERQLGSPNGGKPRATRP